MSETELYRRPLRLVWNRLFRGYPGGREIERFRGIEGCPDDDCPEAWVGSMTHAEWQRKGTAYDPNFGFAEVYVEDEKKEYLKSVIKREPDKFLGSSHSSRYGADTGILVKLLDAQKQLGLQTHPDRDFARKFFNSQYGKTESWYILSTREDQDEEPYVILGFKEGITREIFQGHFLNGDISSMEKCCHKIPVFPGDMFFVDAGVPHAIGPGCFLVEVQEPSDVGVGARLRKFDSPEALDFHIEQTMGCYKYNGSSYDENLMKYRIEPRVLSKCEGGEETLLLGSCQTLYFSITRIDTAKEFFDNNKGTFSIAIVVDGAGTLVTESCSMDVKKGDELFIPAGAGEMLWKCRDPKLGIIKAFPPDVL